MKLQFMLSTLLSLSLASPFDQTWDYIIVGSGASGIPLADRLSESGKTVLLLERGWASSGRWGGTQKPAWLNGTNLTRFDVPSLYQFIWTDLVNNSGILCPDVSTAASCVLGGGTAINAGLFWLPTSMDWDTAMPAAWQSRNMHSAATKAWSRLPWTDVPSKDGKSYLNNGTHLAVSLLIDSSLPHPYALVHANEHLQSRDRVISYAEYFFQNGERHGPMATYLVSASKRKNFFLQLNTTVARVLRSGAHVSGVQVEATHSGCLNGTIKVTPETGRVILSAGVFSTAKILLRSGIGPRDQLRVVQNSTDGPSMIKEKSWITRPVGYNLDDAPAVYLAITGLNFSTYDWEALWFNPPAADVQKYISQRSGPLAEIQPSLGPVFWDEVKGRDNRTRVLQWTVNSGSANGQGALSFAANLNLGHTSRGRLSITPELNVNVSTKPYFNDEGEEDFKALLASASSVLEVLKNVSNAIFLYPPPGMDLETYLRAAIAPASVMTSNHWVGSTRMGSSCSDATAVVDTTTRVCGTQNLHVVDAGIINGVPSANPQGMLVTAAERAAEIILGLEEY